MDTDIDRLNGVNDLKHKKSKKCLFSLILSFFFFFYDIERKAEINFIKIFVFEDA